LHAPAHAAAGHDTHPAPDPAHAVVAHAHAAPAHAVALPGHGHDAAHDAHDAHGGHGHGGTPHESPRSITFVLVALAAGAVLVSVLGIPKAWTHHEPLLEQWLAPSLTSIVPFAEKPHSLEYLLQAIGVGAGAVGWFFARMLYKDARSTFPAALKARMAGAWQVVYDKYYVDELYEVAIVKPSVALGQLFTWFDDHVVDAIVLGVGKVTRFVANVDDAIDKYFVDGAVNAVANATIDSGRALRRIQTGRVQTYLYGALAGGLAVIVLNFLIG
jgi:NADH-quinone oxidoreductase subunit L